MPPPVPLTCQTNSGGWRHTVGKIVAESAIKNALRCDFTVGGGSRAKGGEVEMDAVSEPAGKASAVDTVD